MRLGGTQEEGRIGFPRPYLAPRGTVGLRFHLVAEDPLAVDTFYGPARAVHLLGLFDRSSQEECLFEFSLLDNLSALLGDRTRRGSEQPCSMGVGLRLSRVVVNHLGHVLSQPVSTAMDRGAAATERFNNRLEKPAAFSSFGHIASP
jgi:hypothetical protein